MNGLYDHPDSPAVRYFDLYTQFQNSDIPFWIEEARRAAGPVLELACGTGRVLIPLAQAGVPITGLDLSPGMLAVARRKLAAEPEEVQDRITLVEDDMADFTLDHRFNLIFVAFNSFYALDDEGQWSSLAAIRRHLSDDGRLILALFDPSVTTIAHYQGSNTGQVNQRFTFTVPDSGNVVVLWESRRYHAGEQIAETDYIFEELDAQGRSLARTVQHLRLRYRYRYEMEYLLRLCGYELEALYTGYDRGPYQAGQNDLIWVARPD